MRILIFGPNGSGKGTQSGKLIKRYGLTHVESGGIFRANIGGGTELGKKAKAFIDRGELVPDDITIPMVLDTLAKPECEKGFILDGFPRTPNQSKALIEGLEKANTPLDAVIIIECARQTAKSRLLGRRACPNGHANNLAIEAICPKPDGDGHVCWKCGEPVTARKDDVDEKAIDQRLDIYFSETVASIKVAQEWANNKGVKVINVNGEGAIDEIAQNIQTAIEA